MIDIRDLHDLAITAMTRAQLVRAIRAWREDEAFETDTVELLREACYRLEQTTYIDGHGLLRCELCKQIVAE
jgi:hypothetical protein